MDEHRQELNEEFRKPGPGIGFWAIAALLLYTLSSEPADGLVHRFESRFDGSLTRAGRCIYAPIITLSRVPPFIGPINAYHEFWVAALAK